MAKVNTWERLWGAKRRASDKKLLEALERDIANAERAPRLERDDKETREAIAKAFGRPIH
jgi:hypothetical protein